MSIPSPSSIVGFGLTGEEIKADPSHPQSKMLSFVGDRRNDFQGMTPLILGHGFGMAWRATNSRYTFFPDPINYVGLQRVVITMLRSKKEVRGWLKFWRKWVKVIINSNKTLLFGQKNLKNTHIFLYALQT